MTLKPSLICLKKKQKKENKVLNIKDIKITAEWGYAFIIYEISNKASETKAISTHVQYASGWTGSSIANDINAHLDSIQIEAETWNRHLNIKDIKISPD